MDELAEIERAETHTPARFICLLTKATVWISAAEVFLQDYPDRVSAHFSAQIDFGVVASALGGELIAHSEMVKSKRTLISLHDRREPRYYSALRRHHRCGKGVFLRDRVVLIFSIRKT